MAATEFSRVTQSARRWGDGVRTLLNWLRQLWTRLFGQVIRPAPAGLQCTDYQTAATGYGANPVACAGGRITVYDGAGALINYGTGGPKTWVRRYGGGAAVAHQGLDVGWRAETRGRRPRPSMWNS